MNVISITEHKNCALIFSFFFTSSSFYLHFVFHLLLVRVFHSPLSPDIIKPRRRYWINFSNPRECTKEVQNGNCKHILIYICMGTMFVCQCLVWILIECINICRKRTGIFELYPELKGIKPDAFPFNGNGLWFQF